MRNVRLISSKTIIGELYQDFNIDNDDWVNKANRLIERALGIMRLDGFFVQKTLLSEVSEYKTPLPCDAKYVLAVLLKNGQFFRLPLTRHESIGEVFRDVSYHTIAKGRIENNYLHTTFEKGQVVFVYYAVPKNDEGYLLLPDNYDILEAIPYYIIYRLSLSGYKHPIISSKEAYKMWNHLYPIARNSANYWSIEEAHRFTKMNTNPLYLDAIAEDWDNNLDNL